MAIEWKVLTVSSGPVIQKDVERLEEHLRNGWFIKQSDSLIGSRNYRDGCVLYIMNRLV